MKSKYYEELDISRGIAIIGVVIIHTSSLYLSRFYIESLWIINHMARFSIPLFIMISGFLHKDVSNGNEGTFKLQINYILKRARRIMLPYLLFSIVYMIIRVVIENTPHIRSFVPLHFNSPISIFQAIFLVKGNPAGHLYFLPLLFFVFLTFTLLTIIFQRKNLILSICILVSCLSYYFAGDIYLSINPLKGLVFYALGYTIKDSLYFDTRYNSNRYLLLFSMLFVICLMAYSYNFIFLNKIVFTFGSELFGALSMYLFALKLSRMRFAFIKSVLKKIGQYSFDIYLLHEPYIVTVIFIIFARLSIVNVFVNQSILLLLGMLIPFLLSYHWLRNIKIYRQYFLGLQ